MKWKNLIDFNCPMDSCGGSLLPKYSSLNETIHCCQKCDFYISTSRFNEIVDNIKEPKKFPMPEMPEFMKKYRKVEKGVN